MDKRAFFRLDIERNFVYKLLKYDPGAYFSVTAENEGLIINLSGNGLVFECDEEIGERDFIFGRFKLPNYKDPIAILAKKVRIFNKEIDEEEQKVVALRFLEISIKDQDSIVEFLNRQLLNK